MGSGATIKSTYCPDTAVHVKFDKDNAEKSAQALRQVYDKFGEGAKVLFFREGGETFAVQAKDARTFWHLQLCHCFREGDSPAPEYVNLETGALLAKQFGSHGEDLQNSMQRWFGARKKAVDPKKFLPVIAQQQVTQIDQLHSTLSAKWDELVDENGNRLEQPKSLKKLLKVKGKIEKDIINYEFVARLSPERLDDYADRVADIQHSFWSAYLDAKAGQTDPLPDDDPSRLREQEVVAGLLEAKGVGAGARSGVADVLNSPDNKHHNPVISKLVSGGFANKRTLEMIPLWIGKHNDIIDSMQRKSVAVGERRDVLAQRVDRFLNGLEDGSLSSSDSDSSDDEAPDAPWRDPAVKNVATQLYGRLGRLDLLTYEEKNQRLDEIEQQFNELQQVSQKLNEQLWSIETQIDSLSRLAQQAEHSDKSLTDAYRLALTAEVDEISDEFNRTDEIISCQEKKAALERIDKRISSVAELLLGKPESAPELAHRVEACANLTVALQDANLYVNDRQQQASLSPRRDECDSALFEIISQLTNSAEYGDTPESQLAGLKVEFDKAAHRLTNELEDEDDQVILGIKDMPLAKFKEIQQAVTHGVIKDPQVGVLLAETLSRPVTIYQFDADSNKPNKIEKHEFDYVADQQSQDADPPQPILLAMYGTQFHSVLLAPVSDD